MIMTSKYATDLTSKRQFYLFQLYLILVLNKDEFHETQIFETGKRIIC